MTNLPRVLACSGRVPSLRLLEGVLNGEAVREWKGAQGFSILEVKR